MLDILTLHHNNLSEQKADIRPILLTHSSTVVRGNMTNRMNTDHNNIMTNSAMTTVLAMLHLTVVYISVMARDPFHLTLLAMLTYSPRKASEEYWVLWQVAQLVHMVGIKLSTVFLVQ